MPKHFKPLPNDPGKKAIMSMFDARNGNWLLTDSGEYQTAAVEAMKEEGSSYQSVVILEWPTRKNHSDEKVLVQLMIHPEDALGLAKLLIHTATWMLDNA